MSTAVQDPWFAKLRSSNECDAKFRMRKGEALKAIKAGLIKSIAKSVGPRTHFYVDPFDAYAYWGPR